jgi:hypothetical protein
MQAEPHGDQGIDAPHQQTCYDYVKKCYYHYNDFLVVIMRKQAVSKGPAI